MAAVTLGLGARNLRDTDYFSKSDPFVVVSRPNLAGGFQIIRTSETKNNTLNPDWKDFYFTVDEICNGDTTLNIKFEVYDDDGKKGLDSKDKLIGQGFFSLKHLESAFNVHSNLPITDGKNKQKNKGALVVRTFRYHNMSSPSNNGVGHVPSSGSGYHQSSGGSGYPQSSGGASGRPPYQQPGGGAGYHQSAGESGRPPYRSPVAGYPGGAGMYAPDVNPSARPPIGGYPLGQAMNMGPGMPSYPPQQQPPYGGAPAGGYGGAPGYPGAPGGFGGAPGYPSAPGGLGGAPGYPGAPGGGNPGYPGSAYPGGQNVGGGGLFPGSQLPPGPGYR